MPRPQYEYTETTRALQPDWVHRTRRAPDTLLYKHKNGAASLQNMAARCACSQNIDTKSLAGVPTHLGLFLWRMLCTSGMDSFGLWTVFLTAYGRDEAKALKYRRYNIEEIVDLPWNLFMGPTISPSLQWLTILYLQSVGGSRRDYHEISNLTNLVCLCIGRSVRMDRAAREGPYGLDDRILRNWARAADETGGFKSLKILVWGRVPEVAMKAFEWVSAFPKLSHFVLEDWTYGQRRKGGRHMSDYGWERVKEDFSRDSTLFMSIVEAHEADIPGPNILDLSIGFNHYTWYNNFLGLGYRHLYAFERKTMPSAPRPSTSKRSASEHGGSRGPSKKPVFKSVMQRQGSDALAEFGL